MEEAREAGAPAQHVLFGSWFRSPASLHQIHELGYDVIAYVKKREKIHFCFQCYLKLGKETRFISYDALTAHTSIVFTALYDARVRAAAQHG